MKIFSYSILLLIGLVLSTTAKAENKQQNVYAYGFAASFNDSTVYITEVQTLDTAWLEKKTNFLLSRDNYSYQLRDYLAAKGEKYRTCIISFSTKQKNINKKYKKLIARYTNPKKGNFVIKYLKADEFSFKHITPYEIENPVDEKAEKAKKKQNNKFGNRPDGDRPGGNPPMGGGQPGGRPMGGGPM